MAKRYCPRGHSDHTKKMEKGTAGSDINVIIVGMFFNLIGQGNKFWEIIYGQNMCMKIRP